MNINNIIQEEGKFNITLWRKILSLTANKVGGKEFSLEVINPFGFEVTHDNTFLKRKFRRFFCYIGAANKYEKSSDELIKHFFEEFYLQLKVVDRKFASEIALLIIESDSHFKHSFRPINYKPNQNDKAIILEHRIFQTDLLTDYSEYLIATLWGFQENTLPELIRFNDSEAVRSRIFQLYLIIECIFGSSTEAMNNIESEVYESIFKMKSISLDYYFSGKIIQQPSIKTKQDFEVIRLRLQKIYNSINNPSKNIVRKKIKSYNSQEYLHFEIDLNLLKKTVSKIKESYYSFQNQTI